jgi:hypothetical protein
MDTDATSLKREVDERLLEIRASRLAAFDHATVRWLALLPEWTVSLALSCDFPTAGEPLEELIERGRLSRLCESRSEPGAGSRDSLRFWMPDPMRSSLLDQWQHEDGPQMRAEAAEIAHRILGSIGDGDVAPPSARRWANLAERELGDRTEPGTALTEFIKAALDVHDTAAALEWILTGEALARPLGAEMELAVTRARRQLNLHYRAVQEERYLSRFVERSDQVAAIRRLFESEDNWAVHFIGPGGVGKTMLLRYLALRHPKAVAVSSATLIDFDYIDPRYPIERPARLLEKLAAGLADDIKDDAQESLLRSFRDAVVEAEALDNGDLDSSDPLAALKADAFDRVIKAFAAFVQELPQPTLLILDTCEELAKLHPAGEDVPSVAATFEILERVHEEAPAIRVAFAGRRWLTPVAANRRRDGAAPGSVMSLQERPYLELHEVRGFTREEAVRYLRDAWGLDLDDATIAAVLDRAHEHGRAPSMVDVDAVDDEPRFSPVDLEVFADWLSRDPGVDIPAIGTGDFSGYVQTRILDRLADHPDVLAAVPAAVELQRFDRATIAPALGVDPGMRDLALAGLIEQEWTHLEGGPAPNEIMVQVDPGLLPRLQSYYRDDPKRRRQLDAARETLVPHLAAMLEQPPDLLSPEVVEAALRLLEPATAVELFDRLAERVVEDGAWSWAESVCGRLLSEDREPEDRVKLELLPSLRALYVAALAHRGTRIDLTALWQEVERCAHRHPDLEQASILAARGCLGAVRAAAHAGRIDEQDVAAAYDKARRLLARPNARRVLVPALLATAEALVDLGEEKDVEIPSKLARSCIEWLDGELGSPDTRAYGLTIAGRLDAMRGDWPAARQTFERVDEMLVDEHGGGTESTYADWIRPAALHQRTLLEFLRFTLADRREDDELLSRCERAALRRRGGSDAAQLMSLALQARLASGTLTEEGFERAVRYEADIASYERRAPAHMVAPPLFASVASGWMALGQPARALDLLATREQHALSLRTDDDAARAAALETLEVIRQLRLRDRLALVLGSTSTTDGELRTSALAAGALIVGLQPALGRATDYDHAAWRARILLDATGDEEPLDPAAAPTPADRSAVQAIHAALDRHEAAAIRWQAAGRRGTPPAGTEVTELVATTCPPVAEAASIRDPLDATWLRVTLRLGALVGRTAPIHPRRRHLAGRLALEEGELLALRLPEQAVQLLRSARAMLEETGDAQRAFIAALRSAIAEIHAGRPDEARSRRPEILAHYADVRSRDGHLPAVEDMDAVEGWDHTSVSSMPLRGWLRRLATYLRWSAGDSPPDVDDLGLRLEPELTLTPAARTAARFVTPQVRARADRYSRLVASIALLFSIPILSLVAGSVIGDSFTAGLVLAFALVASASLAEAFGSALPRLLLPVTSFDVSIAPARSPWRFDEPTAEIRVDPRARSRPVRAYLRVVTLIRRPRWTATMSIFDDRPSRLPEPLARAIRPRVRGGYMPIRLVVSSDLAPFGWERRLGSHAMLEDRDTLRWPRVWRRRPPGVYRAPARHLPTEIATACAPRWQPFIERSAVSEVQPLVGLDEPPTSGRRPNTARAVIALGSPVLTRAGWRLRLDDVSMGTDEAPSHGQILASPDRLVREAPVVVVLGRPGGRRPTIHGRMTDGLRGFANEAFLAGAHTVIVVPVLPTATATEVLTQLTREIVGWESRPSDQELAWLTDVLRTTIYRELAGADAPGGDQQRRIELALDVCLFAP